LSRAIVVEQDGIMPKAKAMDQCVVDVLLLNELISIRQHQAAEYFMDICAKSQMYVRSQGYDSLPSSGAIKKDKVYYFPYSRLIKSINKKLSLDHAKVLHDVVIQDIYPESNMAKLEECLNFISDTRWR
jgi:hypothetical protein|tara:strand:- start:644 stop:1030 length:387 start_codon:yes stop_codon:yes gene_type:complete